MLRTVPILRSTADLKRIWKYSKALISFNLYTTGTTKKAARLMPMISPKLKIDNKLRLIERNLALVLTLT